MMKYKKIILISCVVSTTLLSADSQGSEKEYQVDFTQGSGTFKKPTFSPEIQENKDYSWQQKEGIFIANFPLNKAPQKSGNSSLTPLFPTITATFKSDAKDYGILTLRDFSYINSPLNSEANGSTTPKAPTQDDAKNKRLVRSQLTIKNDSTTGFKGFILGGGSYGVKLYSGTNLSINGFTQTTLQGTIYVNAGSISSKTTSDGYLNSSLNIKSDKEFSSLNISSSLYLYTYNSQPRTQEKPVADFNADIKGDILVGGYVSLADKAKANFRAGNIIKITSTIDVSAQEVKKIIEDSLGNQSIDEKDRVKETNLTLIAPKIELNGSINVGLDAKELRMREEVLSEDLKKTTITQYPTDVGSIAQITADINAKQSSNTSTKPKDWVETTKAQFLQNGGSIGVGKNSEVILQTINKKENAKVLFDEKDPYAIVLSNVTIQDQNENNKVLNFSAKAMLDTTSSTQKEKDVKRTLELAEGAGKISLQGKFNLGKNARAKIEAYDGIDLQKDASFYLAQDSLLWLSTSKEIKVTNQGKMELNGGALVLEDNKAGQKPSSLTQAPQESVGVQFGNTGTILLSNANNRVDKNGKRLESSGLFLLAQKNSLDNQGSIVFDGAGNLTTLTSKTDTVARDLEIKNSKGQKGIIDVRGSNNTIQSNGDIKITSQTITMSEKIVEKDKKKETQKGELILYSQSSNPMSKIILGNETLQSGKDRISVTGGVLKIGSQSAGVENYNLRLVDTELDLTQLSKSEKNGEVVWGGGAFVNKRRLELGGGVRIYVANEQGAFVNGEYQNGVKNFQDNLPTMRIQGNNEIFYNGKSETQGVFSFDNNANLELQSNAFLRVGGDFNTSGSVIFNADKFGIGQIGIEGDLIFDMTNHQGGQTINPLIAINHTNFYSLTLNQGYLLLHSNQQIKYRVGSALIEYGNGGGRPQPRGGNGDNLTYAKQQEFLKTEIENYLNGVGPYEGNENKLGIFLKGIAIIDTNNVGFGIVRSDAISKIAITGTPTGVINQYLDILKKSEGQISLNKTNTMLGSINANNPRAMQILNNALEAQNTLELGILKDIGTYNTPNLISTANSINETMGAMANLHKPLLEDFQKMQIVREIAVQNRLMKFSNPFVAEIELAQIVQNIAKYRYASLEQEEQKSDVAPSYIPLENENLVYKNSVWLSALSSTTKEENDNSALYGFSAGYEYMPIANVLLGVYFAYGYSNFKSSLLKNNAHNLDFSAYTRLYYANSELDFTLSYIYAMNSEKIQSNNSLLHQSLDFNSNAFDLSLKYGYVIKIPKIKGMFLKPQAGVGFYMLNIPDLVGVANAPIVYEGQNKGGINFNAGVELRQYVSAFSYLYVLPSFEYNLTNSEENSIVYFSGAHNKMSYAVQKQAKANFSIYAGGEGYISPDFSMNLSAGYKAGLDQEEHNVSISAGFKYKF